MLDQLEGMKVVIQSPIQVAIILCNNKRFIYSRIIEIHSGHVKGSASLFWPRFINPETKTVKSTDEIIKGNCCILFHLFAPPPPTILFFLSFF